MNKRSMTTKAMWFLGILFGVTSGSMQAEDYSYKDDLPRIPQVPVERALSTMHVVNGFSLDLAVADPLVASPVAIAWDEDCRLYVAEMRGYSENKTDRLGRIRVLTDHDRDGHYDDATIFAEDLAWPTALCCWGGGIFVGDAPDILFLKDRDGDNVADERTATFTGFGTSNVQGLLNSFHYGLDNRIYGSASSTGGEIYRVEHAQPVGHPLRLRGRDFSFDPILFDIRPETGGAQHGMGCDDSGNRYVCANSDHAIRCMIEDRYMSRNPDFPPPSGRESIAVDGPQAKVFRRSPVEPWRILRTRLRASGIVPGIVEGGGRPAGYFTSATGITVVGGDMVGDLRGMLVVGDVGSNLVHRKRLVEYESGVRAERVDADEELVASSDIWFRPVQFANGPDGALWIIDMQREVIEHPKSLPPLLKQHLDLTSGRDTGRLWRLTTTVDAMPPLPERLSQQKHHELIALLSHKNVWQRITAQRLLVTSQSKDLVQPLRACLRDKNSDCVGRLHAFWVLVGLDQILTDDVVVALQSDSDMLRKAGVVVAETLLQKTANMTQLTSVFESLAREEPEIGVRLQLACSAGSVPQQAARHNILMTLLTRDGCDYWCRVAACTSMHNDAANLIRDWLEDPERIASKETLFVLPMLFRQIGRRGEKDQIASAIESIHAFSEEPAKGALDYRRHATAIFCALVDACEATGRSLLKHGTGQPYEHTVSDIVSSLLEFNRTVLGDQHATVQERIAAVHGMALGAADSLKAFIDDPNGAVRRAVIQTLDRSNSSRAGQILLEAARTAHRDERDTIISAMMHTSERAEMLLDAIESDVFQHDPIQPSTLVLLRQFSDTNLKQRVDKLLGPPPPVNRQPMINAYRASLPDLPGDRTKGRHIFRALCVQCHRVEGVGNELGPNLAAMQVRGPEIMLLGILDPNREVLPAFTRRTIMRNDGRIINGVLISESDQAVVIRAEQGVNHVIPLDEIASFEDSGKSLMPEGFEKTIHPRDMVHLLAYLMTASRE
ncbi:MAG: PVC-type heme-binding CxxCH protein [Pirellulales bacterium]